MNLESCETANGETKSLRVGRTLFNCEDIIVGTVGVVPRIVICETWRICLSLSLSLFLSFFFFFSLCLSISISLKGLC